MAAGFQAPKGTRDFLPEDLAQRQWIEDRWRTVSTNHGFEEVDGPTFEHLALYSSNYRCWRTAIGLEHQRLGTRKIIPGYSSTIRRSEFCHRVQTLSLLHYRIWSKH